MTRKGQSLVEVVVALGIVSIVFSGTVTLIVQTVNLELSARDRTEAINYAQKILNEKVVEIEGGCNLEYTTGEVSGPPFGKYNSTINVNNNFTSYGNGLDSANFIEITSRVTWKPKGLPDDKYEVKQIVRTR